MPERELINLSDFESAYPALFGAIHKVIPPSMKIYLVGGAVRDILLHRKIRDFDFSVEGLVRPIGKHIADELNGAYYILDDEREMVRVVTIDPEMGTLDIDIALQSGDTIEEDLTKRDFTINAMAIEIENQPVLIDPLNGLKDFNENTLRMCSPDSIESDPLRAFRAIRMSLEFGLTMDDELLKAMETVPARLSESSFERYRDELFKILRLKKSAEAAILFERFGFLDHLAPGWNKHTEGIDKIWLQNYDMFSALITEKKRIKSPLDEFAGFAASRLGNFSESLSEFFEKSLALYHTRRMLTAYAAFCNMLSGGDYSFVSSWCSRLTFSSSEICFVEQTLHAYEFLSTEFNTEVYNDVDIYRYFKKYKEGGIAGIVLYLTDNYQLRDIPEAYKQWCGKVVVVQNLIAAYFSRYREVISPVPLLSGNDIQNILGVPAGPIIGKMKTAMIEAQISGSVKTLEEAESFVRLHAEI